MSNSLLLTDYLIYSACSVCNTVLTIIWIKQTYFSENIKNIPHAATTNVESVASKSDTSGQQTKDTATDRKIQKTIMSTGNYRKTFVGTLYITLSIICATLNGYYYVTYFTNEHISNWSDKNHVLIFLNNNQVNEA
eukprot:196557_1